MLVVSTYCDIFKLRESPKVSTIQSKNCVDLDNPQGKVDLQLINQPSETKWKWVAYKMLLKI